MLLLTVKSIISLSRFALAETFDLGLDELAVDAL